MLLKNKIFYFFLQKSARSNVYKLFLRQYFLGKSTILSKFVAPSSSNFTTSNERFELNNQRKRLSWNVRWSPPLRQKSMKQKLLKMIDFLNKNCLENNLWKLDLADFWRKKLKIWFIRQRTLFFYFLSWIYLYFATIPTLRLCHA